MAPMAMAQKRIIVQILLCRRLIWIEYTGGCNGESLVIGESCVVVPSGS